MLPAAPDALTQIYWNRTRRLWSVRVRGLVTAHVPALALSNCRFRASEASRLRCLRSGARDAHAWVAGTPLERPRTRPAVRIGYRPSEPGFRRRDTGAVIARADFVWLEADGSAWAFNPS